MNFYFVGEVLVRLVIVKMPKTIPTNEKIKWTQKQTENMFWMGILARRMYVTVNFSHNVENPNIIGLRMKFL